MRKQLPYRSGGIGDYRSKELYGAIGNQLRHQVNTTALLPPGIQRMLKKATINVEEAKQFESYLANADLPDVRKALFNSKFKKPIGDYTDGSYSRDHPYVKYHRDVVRRYKPSVH